MYDFSEITIIIGAGAHVPYGFPSGKQLKEEIKKLRNESKLEELYNSLSCTAYKSFSKDILKLVDEFSKSQLYSIDSYLGMNITNHSDRYKLTGKLLISCLILKYEREIELGYTRDDWIQLLINDILKDHLNEFLEKPPKIFTFNYDNFFEHSLCSHLIYAHKYQIDRAKSVIKNLNINHIYGDIDTFNTNDNDYILHNSLENIKVIGEERNNQKLEKISKQIGDAINSSKIIYFLGFGFDELNCNLIFKNYNDEDKLFLSTNYGLSKFERNEILKRIPIRMHSSFINYKEKIDCMELLKVIIPLQKASELIIESKKPRASNEQDENSDFWDNRTDNKKYWNNR